MAVRRQIFLQTYLYAICLVALEECAVMRLSTLTFGGNRSSSMKSFAQDCIEITEADVLKDGQDHRVVPDVNPDTFMVK
jgi:hypothetical protein